MKKYDIGNCNLVKVDDFLPITCRYYDSLVYCLMCNR